MSQNTNNPAHQPGQDTNEPALEDKEKELKAKVTKEIRSLLDSEDESETINNEDEYYPSQQEEEDEMFKGLVDAFSEAKKSGIDTSEMNDKTDFIIKSMLLQLLCCCSTIIMG